MSSRSTLRRKAVIAVTVIRHNGQEKQLAHTLDVTEASARLGGLATQLEPGEVIEIQRSRMTAKFQVFWMGTPGSAMAGQAGIRCLTPLKNIWGVDLPQDEADANVDISKVRSAALSLSPGARLPGELRWHTRYECEGAASVKTAGSACSIRGVVKDISEGGIYVESSTPLPVNTQVDLNLNIEGVWLDASGMVRTSYPLVGMGISFQSVVGNNREKLDVALERLKRRKSSSARPRPEETTNTGPGLPLDAGMLAQTCRAVSADFDTWKSKQIYGEVEELRRSIDQLQQKLPPVSERGELMDLVVAATATEQRGEKFT